MRAVWSSAPLTKRRPSGSGRVLRLKHVDYLEEHVEEEEFGEWHGE